MKLPAIDQANCDEVAIEYCFSLENVVTFFEDAVSWALFATEHGSRVGASRQLVRRSDMFEVAGRPEVTGRRSNRRD
jgi:hypothetical protein